MQQLWSKSFDKVFHGLFRNYPHCYYLSELLRIVYDGIYFSWFSVFRSILNLAIHWQFG